MNVRVQLNIYVHPWIESPSIYYTYLEGHLLHTKHVNIYERLTFIKLQI